MIVLDETASVVRSALVLMNFYEHESCGQCSQCREGTQWLAQVFQRLHDGQGREEDLELLRGIANGMAPGKTICALSDAAAIPTHSVLRNFADEIEEYVREGGHEAVMNKRQGLAGAAS
jgi:NADH-quinone oxidoreductase subunit F